MILWSGYKLRQCAARNPLAEPITLKIGRDKVFLGIFRLLARYVLSQIFKLSQSVWKRFKSIFKNPLRYSTKLYGRKRPLSAQKRFTLWKVDTNWDNSIGAIFSVGDILGQFEVETPSTHGNRATAYFGDTSYRYGRVKWEIQTTWING